MMVTWMQKAKKNDNEKKYRKRRREGKSRNERIVANLVVSAGAYIHPFIQI
jgi:hypothetical protein